MPCQICSENKLSCFDVNKTSEYTNTFCHNCGAHLYGKRGSERWYKKKEWFAFVNNETQEIPLQDGDVEICCDCDEAIYDASLIQSKDKKHHWHIDCDIMKCEIDHA